MSLPNSFLGSGDLYVDILGSGNVSTGYQLLGNATMLSIQANAELKEQTAKGRSTYGQVIASVSVGTPHDLKITFNQLDRTVMAMAWLGTAADIAVTGAAVTNQAITFHHDKWTDIGKRDLSAITVTNTGATVTYVLDTDYNLNTRLGWVKALSTGAITDGQAGEIDYTYASKTGFSVVGANQSSIRIGLYFDGKNLVTLKDCQLTIYAAQLVPTSAIDLLADDFSGAEMDGRMITPAGYDHPYIYKELD